MHGISPRLMIQWLVCLGIAAAVAACSPSFADDAAEIAHNQQWAEAAFSATSVTALPFSFVYDGQASKDILGTWTRSVVDEQLNATTRRRTLTLTDPATQLEVKAVACIYTDTAGVDWTIYFTNKGTSDTPVIEQVRAVDAGVTFSPGTSLVVHQLNGGRSGVDDWMPFDSTVSQGSRLDMSTSDGLSSNVCPFFNVDWGTGGVITAIGWTGQWTASVDYPSSGSARVSAGMQYMHLKLHPGESVRSPRIMQVYWTGTDQWRGYSLFRRTMLSHIMPRIDGKLVTPPIVHLGTAFYEMNASTEQNTLSHLEALDGLGFESYWLDAYYLTGDFPLGVGNWGFPISRAVSADRFPNGIKPIGDAAHAKGMEFVLWVQPETVCPNTALANEHPEWIIWPSGGLSTLFGSGLFNLGIPEARQYMTNYLTTIIAAYGIDCMRFDFFPSPIYLWLQADSATPDRQGISEIRYVEGMYKMWDDILADPSKPFIDNCASGGRRVDLETCARSLALWRTDATIGPLLSHDFDQASMQNQVMTGGLSRYVPYSTSGQMGITPYQFRGGFNAGISFCEDVRPTDYPKETLKQAIAEGKRIRKYYFGEFYPLTPVTTSISDWCVFQYHLPETDEGMVMAFKRQSCADSIRQCELSGIDTQANYDVYVSPAFQQGSAVAVTGAQLAHLMIEIADKPGSVIVEYTKNGTTGTGVVSGTVQAILPNGSTAPIAEATIRVVGAPVGTTSGEDGSYTLSLAPGTYTLECSRTGYPPEQATVTVQSGGSAVQDFAFHVTTVTGKVTINSAGQQPISGATVQTSDGACSTNTDSLGQYALAVSTGQQTLVASALGYASRGIQVDVAAGGTTVQDFSLDVSPIDSVSTQFALANPSGGAWTYGWKQTLGSAITLYDQLSSPATGLQMWNMQTDAGAGIAGLVWKNTSTQASDQWGWTEAGQVCLHPGPTGQKAIARWTAQGAGHITIMATFSGQNPSGTTTDIRVAKNGVSLFDRGISGFAGRSANSFADKFGTSPLQTYNGEVDVASGDTIEFAVGYGSGSYNCDLTGLDATITVVSIMPSLSAVRSAAIGTLVRVYGQVATTDSGAFGSQSLYVEDPNRVSGIKVIAQAGQSGILTGQRVRIDGTLGKDSTGELTILDASFRNTTTGAALRPIGVSSAGISRQTPAVSGMLVRVWGQVSYRASDSSYIYVDDGRGVTDGSAQVGVRVIPNGGTVPLEGQIAGATGLVGLAIDGTATVPVIRARNSTDIKTY